MFNNQGKQLVQIYNQGKQFRIVLVKEQGKVVEDVTCWKQTSI